MSEHFFYQPDNSAGVCGQGQPGGEADEQSAASDQHSLQQKNAGNAAGRRAHGAQNGNIRALVANGGDQRRDNVKGGDRNNERQNHKHHALFQGQGAEQIAVAGRPVVEDQVGADFLQFGADPGGGEDVAQFQADGRHRAVGQAIDFAGVVQVDIRQVGVVLMHAGVEDGDDLKPPQAGEESGGGEPSARRDQHNRVAGLGAEAKRESLAQHQVKFSGPQQIGISRNCVLFQVADFDLLFGEDSFYSGPADDLPADEEGLFGDVWRGGQRVGMRQKFFRGCLPVGNSVAGGEGFQV